MTLATYLNGMGDLTLYDLYLLKWMIIPYSIECPYIIKRIIAADNISQFRAEL
jgi:hypothetical protein